MREKCSYADKYKATRAPRCGCRVCERKWKDALLRESESISDSLQSLKELEYRVPNHMRVVESPESPYERPARRRAPDHDSMGPEK